MRTTTSDSPLGIVQGNNGRDDVQMTDQDLPAEIGKLGKVIGDYRYNRWLFLKLCLFYTLGFLGCLILAIGALVTVNPGPNGELLV
jgi:hypothetical protein